MTSCDKSRLVSSIMLDRENQVYVDLFRISGWATAFAMISKAPEAEDIIHFNCDRIAPLGIAILLVEFVGLLGVAQHLISVHINWLRAKGMKLGLVG